MTPSASTHRSVLALPPDMSQEYSFCIRFSGITIRFIAPTALNLPECITELLCCNCEVADAEYRITLLESPLSFENAPVYTDGNSHIYETNQGRLRVYFPLTEEDGCQVACLFTPERKNTLYYPAKRWNHYRKYWHCAHLLWGEMLLMHLDAFLLHSSVVLKDNKAVLFCGESGAGKSTQADLWKTFANAEIINGDRCVIRNQNGVFFGGGSLWSGTSGIYSPLSAPIAGIITLKKGENNSIRKLEAEAFPALFSQITLNLWDEEFMHNVTGNLLLMLQSVPVWELTCDKSREAVSLAYKTIFSKELPL